MINIYLVRKVFSLGEEILYRLPPIKSVYRAFRDFFYFFSLCKEGLGQEVSVMTISLFTKMTFYTFQLMGSLEFSIKKSLIFEKGLLP